MAPSFALHSRRNRRGGRDNRSRPIFCAGSTAESPAANRHFRFLPCPLGSLRGGCERREHRQSHTGACLVAALPPRTAKPLAYRRMQLHTRRAEGELTESQQRLNVQKIVPRAVAVGGDRTCWVSWLIETRCQREKKERCACRS